MRKFLGTLIILTLALFALYLRTSSSASANWRLDGTGQLHFGTPSVLGKSDNPGKGPQSNSNSQKSSRPDTPPGKGKSSNTSDTTSPGKSGNRAIIRSQGNKLNIKFTGKAANQLQSEEGTPSGEFDIEDPDDTNVTTIQAHGNASLIIRNKIAAQTHFPLMVDLDTNELIVTTPNGDKTVRILPDKAVQNMLAANVLDQLGGKGGINWLLFQQSLATPSAEATDSADPEATSSAQTRKVSICHATGSQTNPFVQINLSRNGWENGHEGKHQSNGIFDYLLDEDGDGANEFDCTISGDKTSTDSADLAPIATESAEPSPSDEASPSASASPAPTLEESPVTLTTTDDGDLVYTIDGFKNKRFLGLFKVQLKRTAVVSAETGELLGVNQNFPTRLIDFFSI